MQNPLPVMSYVQRQARAAQKADILLKFLGSGDVFTTSDIAAELLCIDRRRASALLQKLEQNGALKSETHLVSQIESRDSAKKLSVKDVMALLKRAAGDQAVALTALQSMSEKRISTARTVRIYGISPHGIALADCYGNPHFELGRTNAAWINHRLDTQRMRIRAAAAGWTGWTPERILRLTPGMKKIPDAISINKLGQRISIEIERSCKTSKRYSELIVIYLQEIKAGKIDEVHYVCPAGVSKLVKKCFESIDTVKFHGDIVKLEQKHRDRFKFFDFDEWAKD